jgi:hypothetical protein
MVWRDKANKFTVPSTAIPNPAQAVRIGVAWLREEDWPEWQEIDDDPKTYAEWREKISEAMVALTIAGHDVEKVTVIPSDYLKWRKKQKATDSPSRAKYASEALARKAKSRRGL